MTDRRPDSKRHHSIRHQPIRQWTWPWLIATASARALLAVVVGLALWAAVPAAIGWKPTTVSSGSMLPRLQVGDVAVSRPLGGQPPTIGSVLLFDDPDHPDRLRLHRFVAISDDGELITRGDANPDNDSTPITPAAVRGVGTLRVPWVGLPVIWVREGAWLPLGLTLLGLVGLGALAAQSRRFTFDPPDDLPPAAEESAPSTPTATSTATSGNAVQMITGGLAVGTALIMVAVPSAAAFSATTSSAASLGAADYFSCANAVLGKTNGTTITTPAYLWYRMDETSSTTANATDSSGNTRTGAYGLTGKTASQARACGSRDTGTAMLFNGTSGYLSSPQVTGAAPDTFTIAIRFKTAVNYARGGKLIGYGSSRTGASVSYDRHLYLTNAGQVTFGVYPDAVKTIKSTGDALTDGQWHQAVGTLSSDGMKLYVDGVLEGTDSTVTRGQALTGGYWRIAYDNLDSWTDQPTSRFFGGTLDDAVVYTTALTADQIADQWVATTS